MWCASWVESEVVMGDDSLCGVRREWRARS